MWPATRALWCAWASPKEPRSLQSTAWPGEVRMVDPNVILIFDLDSAAVQRHTLHEFDLRQFKQELSK